MELMYALINRFLLLMADGWRLPFPVEPMMGHHGQYSILMRR